MHLRIAASLLCWAGCWAIADQAKAATESAIAKKSLLLMVDFLSGSYSKNGPLPIGLRLATEGPLGSLPDEGVGFLLILFWAEERRPDGGGTSSGGKLYRVIRHKTTARSGDQL